MFSGELIDNLMSHDLILEKLSSFCSFIISYIFGLICLISGRTTTYASISATEKISRKTPFAEKITQKVKK